MTGRVAKHKYALSVLDDTPRPAHIQRCTYAEVRSGHTWQCRLTDPHPDIGHDLPIDARFGRPLHQMHPDKLAALVRDHVALTDNMQRRLDELQAIAIDLVTGWVGGTGVKPATAAWVAANAPTAAQQMGWQDH